MQSDNSQIIVVPGATGNVGPFVVRALLNRGHTVAVTSRSERKLAGLRAHLRGPGRLHTFAGEVGDTLRQRIVEEVGTPDGVVASVGDFVTTPSLLAADPRDLQRAIDGYLISNFSIARAFLPELARSGGTYVLVQGPLAFEPRPELGTDLISIATAGQHMLFRALARELDGTLARVVELVIHAFIRDRETQPGSPLPGEAVGDFTARLLSGDAVHGQSIRLRSLEQVAA